MERTDSKKSFDWKFGAGIVAGIIIYKIFSEYIWPAISL